jgi:hypothetical protein
MSDNLEEQIIFDGSDLLDVAVDLATDIELLESLPFFGSAVKAARLALSVRDRLFLRKVQLFLLALPKIGDAEKARLHEQLDNDKDFRDRVGETLVLILERLDSMKKPEMLAKVFAYFIKGKIDDQEFRRLASAIDLAFVDDLMVLSRGPVISDDTLWSLVRAGFAQITTNTRERRIVTIGEDKLVYQIGVEQSKLGDLFRRAMSDF